MPLKIPSYLLFLIYDDISSHLGEQVHKQYGEST